MHRQQLEHYLRDYLAVDSISDYCPNGLQIEGRQQLQRIVTGVTASQALIDAAVACKADAILVHHGYFWKNEPAVITGMKHRRIKTLLSHDINLFAYHLPLDIHPEVGNNHQLAKLFGFNSSEAILGIEPRGLVRYTELADAITSDQLADRIASALQRPLTCMVPCAQPIRKIAWCSGGGQGYIDAAAAQGCDAFISGEVSEQTVHSAREQGIAFYAAGHHATERCGIKALGEHIAAQFELQVEFIDIDNPA
ncbi:MAG: GTP cyclohydrolase 1 type 2 [Pseudidiomarina mangrovi]|nr:MAG: GTP cyclohydrolase 1 type 2 [Pseudidiomarina mangrovi]